ncbi:MAG: glycosyltransferase family 4 protein [Anaerolineae bacterium]|nr:glycosyltransferase family 4 protein [Anaerolineae bacterium]
MHTGHAHVALNAHLLTAQAGFRRAGIGNYMLNLIRALPEADPALSYTVLAGSQAPRLEDARLRERHTPWSTEKPLRRILWEQIAQPLALREVQPDLVHALAFVTPVASRVPSVVTVYDLSFIHYPDVLPAARRLYLRLLARRSCRHARRVIAISQSTARDLETTFGLPPDKIDVAPPGVGEQFRPLPSFDVEAFRSRNGLPDRFLLFVGTLEPRKNLPVLLRAYADLPEVDRAVMHLVVAGSRGWMYDEVYRTIEAYGLSDTVHLPDFLPDEELPLWYNAAEAFVYPSVFEGFGLPVAEAMACGTPVLVSDAASLPEVAGDTGFRLPPDDVPAWTEAMARAIHDPAWREDAGQRGRAHAAQFTWANTAAQTVASYRRALHGVQDRSHG